MLAPGPFRPGAQSSVAIQPGTYDFTSDALTLAGQLQGIASGWDAFLFDLADLATQPADPTAGFNYGAMLVGVQTGQQLATLPSLDGAMQAATTAGALLSIATSFAPAAAWTNPTAPFVPPDPTQTIVVPTIPIGEYNPTINGSVGGGAAGGPATVSLSNLTRVGSTNFFVGDSFLITVVASGVQQISVDGYFNSVPLPYLLLGSTDSQGDYALSNVMGPDNVGAWLENYYVAGQLIATFSFIVSPAS